MNVKSFLWIACVLLQTLTVACCSRKTTCLHTTTPMKIIYCTDAEIDRVLSEFDDANSTEDRALSEQQLVERYDSFFELVECGCRNVGTFGDALQMDADFISSRWVDPTRIVTVVSSKVITPVAVQSILEVVSKSKVLFAVDFDSIGGRLLLFSDGRLYTRR